MFGIIRDILDYRHVLHTQVHVTLRTTVATTRLGALWWVLDPVILMLLYTFVVKMIFERGGPDYHLFALCGIVTWQSFSRSVSLCTTSLNRNTPLIKHSNLPMHLYVLLPAVVQCFFYLIGLGIVAVWNYETLGWHTASAIILLFPMVFIPYSLGLFLSILTVRLPDIGKIIPYILRFGFYLSPVLYPAERLYELPNVNQFIKILYNFNPMVHVIAATRDIFLVGKMFDLTPIVLLIGITLVFIQAGITVFRFYSKVIPKLL